MAKPLKKSRKLLVRMSEEEHDGLLLVAGGRPLAPLMVATTLVAGRLPSGCTPLAEAARPPDGPPGETPRARLERTLDAWATAEARTIRAACGNPGAVRQAYAGLLTAVRTA